MDMVRWRVLKLFELMPDDKPEKVSHDPMVSGSPQFSIRGVSGSLHSIRLR